MLEGHVLRLVAHFRERTALPNLCVAGGVGLNVKLNSRLYSCGLFDDVFVFPIPSDSGTAVGAAAGVFQDATGTRVQPLEHVYWGPESDDAAIERELRSCGVEYHACDDVAEATAELLAQGKVVAWFQGRLEGGPRALGGRSILADPRDTRSRDRVNGAVKFREYWRPFCPSITEEAAPRYLQQPKSAPFMILAFDATDAAVEEIPVVVHVDRTMRVQTVDERANPPCYRLLKAYERRTGVPALLNTSFNVKGEAVVASPRDALRTFWSTGLDALAIGSFVVTKPHAPNRDVSG